MSIQLGDDVFINPFRSSLAQACDWIFHVSLEWVATFPKTKQKVSVRFHDSFFNSMAVSLISTPTYLPINWSRCSFLVSLLEITQFLEVHFSKISLGARNTKKTQNFYSSGNGM